MRKIEKHVANHPQYKGSSSTKHFFDLLYCMIERHIANNLETGNLIFPHNRHLLQVSDTQLGSLKLYDCAKFMNTYSDLKKDIFGICQNRSQFYQAIIKDGVNMDVAYKHGRIFCEARKSVLNNFKTLMRRCGSKFTPLMMLYGTYLSHIEQQT